MFDITIDARMYDFGGVGTYLKHIIPALCSKYNVHLIVNRDDLIRPQNLNAVITNVASNILTLKENIEIPFAVKKSKVFWSPQFNYPLFPVFNANHKVITIHDLYHLDNPDKFSSLRLKYLKLKIYNAINSSEFIFTVSEFTKSRILAHFNCSSEKIVVSHLGVDEEFATFKKTETVLSAPFILFVGNVKPHKNIAMALKAFMKSSLSKTHVAYVVGQMDGFITLDNEVLNLTKQYPERIFFTGKISDNSLKNYYSEASLFVFPSKYEGFGLPLLEAMKFNLPIVSSNAASLTEIGGDAIEYFNPDSVEELADKFDLFSSNRLKFIDYTKHLAEYKWENTIETHLKTFKKLID